ncbi:MAG: hypothetical protein M3Y08_18815 [Fibrobacterota bacterium]|nr:hypothetical protein [Fibrobacterota bacterium]
MRTGRKDEEGNHFYRNLQGKILKEMGLLKEKWIRSKETEFQLWYETKIAILQDLLMDAETARAGNLKTISLLQECIQSRELCQNPGLKKVFQIKVQVLRELMGTARAQG